MKSNLRFVNKSSLVAALLLAGSLQAFAQATLPPSQGVLSLTTTATVEVAKDLMSVTFSVTREGNEAGGVQAALKQALDAALAEARKVAKPREVEVQTGNFSIYPRYGNQGRASGWQGSAELVVEGRDMATIAQLTGRIQSMTIARVGYGLSREAREKVEAEVTGQAITRFRAKAEQMAKQFGYGSAAVREVNVATDEPGRFNPAPMMRAKTMASADEALPVEAGKGTVTATVSGSVQMR